MSNMKGLTSMFGLVRAAAVEDKLQFARSVVISIDKCEYSHNFQR